MTIVVSPMSNAEFARRVGCHHTMASRLRNGLRMPSAEMLSRILDAFPLAPEDEKALLVALAHGKGKEEVGRWLREHVFGDPA